MYDYIKSHGAIIFIHKPNEQPIFEVEGISVATGVESYIVIDRVITQKLDAPYSDCIMDVKNPESYNSGLYRAAVNMTGTYYQTYCLQICYQLNVIGRCNCSDELSPGNELSRPCKNFAQLECMFSALEHLTRNSTTDQCFKECMLFIFAFHKKKIFKIVEFSFKGPRECNKITYDHSISFSDYPSPFYSNLLYNNTFSKSKNQLWKNVTTYDQIRKSVLSVLIFYDDISETTVTENPDKDLQELISDLVS
jgi:hypothetical protein